MDIKINLKGEYDIITSNAYNNIAGSYLKLDRIKESEKYYMKALEIREKYKGNKEKMSEELMKAYEEQNPADAAGQQI